MIIINKHICFYTSSKNKFDVKCNLKLIFRTAHHFSYITSETLRYVSPLQVIISRICDLKFCKSILRLSLIIVSGDVRATEDAIKKMKLQITYMYLHFVDRPCCRIDTAETQRVPLQTRK